MKEKFLPSIKFTRYRIAVSALAKVAEGLLFFLLGAFIFGIQIDQ
jgi:hypothetical protein